MTDNIKTLTVIGCGWLGLPLALKAIDENWKVKGTTTNSNKMIELEDKGIEPYLLVLPATTKIDSALFKSRYLVINIPPGRRNPNVLHDYPFTVSQIIDQIKIVGKTSKVIFVSSTSVYGNEDEFIDETTISKPKTDSGRALVEAENIVRNAGINYNILRFGGLAGPGRHPGRFLAGKKDLPGGNQCINFLHLTDAIAVIMHMLSGSFTRQTYNVVSPQHPQKKMFYLKMTIDAGLDPPTFDDSLMAAERKISVQKLLKDTGYEFKYPDPMYYDF